MASSVRQQPRLATCEGSRVPGSVSKPRGRPPLPVPFSPQGQGCPAFWGSCLRRSAPAASARPVSPRQRSPQGGRRVAAATRCSRLQPLLPSTAPGSGLLEAPSPARVKKSGWPKDDNRGRHKLVFVIPTIKQLQGKGFASTHAIHSSEWNDFRHVSLLLTITRLAL